MVSTNNIQQTKTNDHIMTYICQKQNRHHLLFTKKITITQNGLYHLGLHKQRKQVICTQMKR